MVVRRLVYCLVLVVMMVSIRQRMRFPDKASPTPPVRMADELATAEDDAREAMVQALGAAEVWLDPDFEASMASCTLTEDPEDVEGLPSIDAWKRLSSEAVMYGERGQLTHSMGQLHRNMLANVVQGEWGTCYFLGVVQAMALRPLMRADDLLLHDVAHGIHSCRFWFSSMPSLCRHCTVTYRCVVTVYHHLRHQGSWTYVLLDDYVPVRSSMSPGKYFGIGSECADRCSSWLPMLEKVLGIGIVCAKSPPLPLPLLSKGFAKLCWCYGNVQGLHHPNHHYPDIILTHTQYVSIHPYIHSFVNATIRRHQPQRGR